MTRRLLASNLRQLLNPATTPNPKPFSFPTTNQNPLSQSHLFSWQLKPHRRLFFSTTYNYKFSGHQLLARARNALPPRSQGGLEQIVGSMRRFWSDQIMTPEGVILFLVGTNVAVFILWRNMDPSFMIKHFMISLDNFKNGWLHTLVTCAFSHIRPGHITNNMLGLYIFGRSIAVLFGPKFLLKLYLGGALVGSIFFLVEQAFLVPSDKGNQGVDKPGVHALGASAAVNAIVMLYVFLFPKSWVLLDMLIPVPAAVMGAVYITADLWRVLKGGDNVSGAGHLGGAFVAALVRSRIRKRFGL
ncbi:hypothetical protein LUZ61_002469 [Rhynchospora tenuis]|uniref:Peptidase S54 rhomboid domain-containing protein n=1 Tax=Rhynchospora tenuis TaxID=198213 RepID=A0AAD5ZIY6_9POAL|nr:hypothetical protein LUZ61_002469 [Rhynchospora tenuis]